MEKQMITKETYSCQDCGNTDVLLLAWVDPNDGNKFVNKVDDPLDGLCNVCGDCVGLDVETVEVPDDPWRCEECGSLDVECKISVDANTFERAGGDDYIEHLCLDCENKSVVRESALMATINDWFDNHLQPDDFEVITGLTEWSGSEEEHLIAGRAIWNSKTNEEKIEIWHYLTQDRSNDP